MEQGMFLYTDLVNEFEVKLTKIIYQTVGVKKN